MIKYRDLFTQQNVEQAFLQVTNKHPDLVPTDSQILLNWKTYLLRDLTLGKTSKRWRMLQGTKPTKKQILSKEIVCCIILNAFKTKQNTIYNKTPVYSFKTQHATIRSLMQQVNTKQTTLCFNLLPPLKKIQKSLFFTHTRTSFTCHVLVVLLWEIWYTNLHQKTNLHKSYALQMLDFLSDKIQLSLTSTLDQQIRALRMGTTRSFRYKNQVFTLIQSSKKPMEKALHQAVNLQQTIALIECYKIYGTKQNFIALQHSIKKVKKNKDQGYTTHLTLAKQQLLNVLKEHQIIGYKNNLAKAQTLKRLIYQHDTQIVSYYQRLFEQLKIRFQYIHNKSQFQWMGYYLSKSMQKTLAAKYRVSTRIIRQRYPTCCTLV